MQRAHGRDKPDPALSLTVVLQYFAKLGQGFHPDRRFNHYIRSMGEFVNDPLTFSGDFLTHEKAHPSPPPRAVQRSLCHPLHKAGPTCHAKTQP